jgi:hypothetical protein
MAHADWYRRRPCGVRGDSSPRADPKRKLATRASARTAHHRRTPEPRRPRYRAARPPEDVPIPKAAPLASPRPLRIGEQIDGNACQGVEQLAFHIHTHLSIVVRGRSRQVPAGIGVAPPYEVELTPAGRFVAGASCFTWLHTHAADGIVHIESAGEAHLHAWRVLRHLGPAAQPSRGRPHAWAHRDESCAPSEDDFALHELGDAAAP